MHVCIVTYKRFLTEKINGKKFFHSHRLPIITELSPKLCWNYPWSCPQNCLCRKIKCSCHEKLVWNFFLDTILQSRSLWKTKQTDNKIDLSTLKSLIEEPARLNFSNFFATLVEDFQPARLINLKNISSLLVYSVLLA